MNGWEGDRDDIKYYAEGVQVSHVRKTYWHQSLFQNFDGETWPGWFGMPADVYRPSKCRIEYVGAWKRKD